MEPVIAGGQYVRFHTPDGADQHRLDVRRMFPYGIGDGQGRHQVPSGATPGNEDATGAGGQLGRLVRHVRVGSGVLLPFSLPALRPRCLAAPLDPSAAPAARKPVGSRAGARY